MPDDPDALYALVLKSQGLNFPGVKPWHIKASYTLFDGKGTNPVNGVFEEWWTGPHKYKLSYIRAGFTQTDYGTDAGIYRVGEQQWPMGEELWIPIELMEPLPNVTNDKAFIVQAAELTGTVKLRCIMLADPAQPAEATGRPTFCIDPPSPALRLSMHISFFRQTVYNRILSFQGHYVAGDILTNANQKSVFQLKVETLEGIPSPNDGLFTPPADAVLVPPGRVTLPPGTARTLSRVGPAYPAFAKAARSEGAVHFHALIDGTGHVTKATIVDGPAALQQAALDAMRQWVFRPFLVGGEPVEVDTVTTIIFKLGS